MSDEPKTPQEEPQKPGEETAAPAAGPQESSPASSGQTGGFNEFGIPLDDSGGKIDAPAVKEGEAGPPGTSSSPEDAPAEEGPRKILDELDKARSEGSQPSAGGENNSAPEKESPSGSPDPGQEPPPEPSLEGEPLITDAMRRLDDMLERLRRRRDAA